MRKVVLPIELVELEEGNFHIFIKSIFPGGASLRWVIDTGASKSVFDSSLTEYYQPEGTCNTNEILSAGIGVETFTSQTALFKEIYFDSMKVTNFKVALIDLSHINKLYEKYTSKKICGLIGSDFLNKYKAVIDYKNQKLKLSPQK